MFKRFNLTYNLLGIVFLLCVMKQSASGQTFSKFQDLGVGFNDKAMGTILLQEDQFVLSAIHSGDDFIITSFSRYDYQGNLLSLDTINDFVIGEENSLVKTDNGYDALGHQWSKDITGARDIRILKLNENFGLSEVREIYYREGISVNAHGILEGEKEYILYANKITNDPSYGTQGYISFYDTERDSILNEITVQNVPGKIFEHYGIRSIQKTLDGNYAYIGSLRSDEIGSRFDLIKMNRKGEELASINGRLFQSTQAGLVQDTEGNFYFFSQDSPYFIDPSEGPILPDGGGGLVKVNADLDSVLWTIQFNPDRTTIDLDKDVFREYTPKNIITLRDGNFLLYGNAIGTLNDITENGAFLLKFSQEGEVLWIRVYRPELDESLQAINQDRTHTPTFLEDCKELPDGRILCSSTLRFRLPDNPIHNEIWLMMLDDEGCLFPGCDEVTFITSTSSTLPTQEGRVYPNPVSDVLQIADVSFDRYEIVDIVGRQVQVGGFSTEVALSSRMSKGMYILQLIEDGQLKSVFKFLKE